MLEIKGVSKSYRKNAVPALDGFSAKLEKGIYAILGPNGAGKSTLMNIIAGNVVADAGEVLYQGKSTKELGKEFREILGFMPQQQSMYEDFTASQFLWYMASLKGLSRKEAKERIPELLQVVHLEDSRYKKLGAFSGGMKQRILIAQALLNDPDVLILDEPTAGLDPKERIRIRNFISEIGFKKTVLLATHVVSDVEYISKEVLCLKQGKLVLKDKPENILKEMKDKVFLTEVPIGDWNQVQENYLVSNILGEDQGKVMAKIVAKEQPKDFKVSTTTATLEDVYLYLFEGND